MERSDPCFPGKWFIPQRLVSAEQDSIVYSELLDSKEPVRVNIPLRRRRQSGKEDSASPAKTAALRSLSLPWIQSVDLSHRDIL